MDSWGALEGDLAGLRTYDADPQKVEQIRARCLRALEVQRRRERAGRLRLAQWRNQLELAAACGLSCLYLAAAVATSLSFLR